ncbi:MAG: hypothetical protein QXU06_02605 [Candidatus Bathyarchaeia archaeon]
MREAGGVDDFERALAEAVDETLLYMGDRVRLALYSFLRKHYGIEEDRIPSKLDAFEGGLRSVFGDGADILFRMIARRLYGKLGIPFEGGSGGGLRDYVERARAAMANRGLAP